MIKIEAIPTVQRNESFTFPDIKVFGLLFYGVNAALSCRTYRGGENVSWGVLGGVPPSTLPSGSARRARLVTAIYIDILGWLVYWSIRFLGVGTCDSP